jgi:hypothetical protein
VYAVEHDPPMDAGHLAAVDFAELTPLCLADGARARSALDVGLTIEELWLMEQLLNRRPSTCILVQRFAGQPLNRITRLRISTAPALVAELVDRLVRNFRFPGTAPWAAAIEDAHYPFAEPIAAGVLIRDTGHVISLVSADPRSGELTYHDAWPNGTLLPSGQAGDQPGVYRIGSEELAASVAYALMPDVAPVERSPDIYAPSVLREGDPSKGNPLDVAWALKWDIAGPLYCLVVEGTDAGPTERIPYLAEVSVDQLVGILVAASSRRERFLCTASVRITGHSGHSVTIVRVDDRGVVFHDPWPEGSLLAAGRNELGIDAHHDSDGWRITTEELARCVQAVFIAPHVLAETQGYEHRKSLDAVFSALAHFNVHEISRARRDEIWEVEAQPGGFRENVRIRFAIDGNGWLDAARLSVQRSWMDTNNRPYAIDIIKSFLGATVSPLDEDEVSLAVRGIWAINSGREALEQALGAGAPHLLGQTRRCVRAILGGQEPALLTYAFTRVVILNGDGDDPWLEIGVERGARSAGPLLVGTQLPAPWCEQDR